VSPVVVAVVTRGCECHAAPFTVFRLPRLVRQVHIRCICHYGDPCIERHAQLQDPLSVQGSSAVHVCTECSCPCNTTTNVLINYQNDHNLEVACTIEHCSTLWQTGHVVYSNTAQAQTASTTSSHQRSYSNCTNKVNWCCTVGYIPGRRRYAAARSVRQMTFAVSVTCLTNSIPRPSARRISMKQTCLTIYRARSTLHPSLRM
jgi:hypothetical protein